MSSPSFVFSALCFAASSTYSLTILRCPILAVYLSSRRAALCGSVIPFIVSQNHHPAILMKHFASLYMHSSSLQFASALSLVRDSADEKNLKAICEYFTKYSFYSKKQLRTLVLENFAISPLFIKLLSIGFSSLQHLSFNSSFFCPDYSAEAISKFETIKQALNDQDDDDVFPYIETLDLTGIDHHRSKSYCSFFHVNDFGANSLRTLTWYRGAKIEDGAINFFNQLSKLERLHLCACELNPDAFSKNPIEQLSSHLKHLELTEKTLKYDYETDAILTMFTKGNCITGKSPLRSLVITGNHELGQGTRNILRELEGLEKLEVPSWQLTHPDDDVEEQEVRDDDTGVVVPPVELLLSPKYSLLGSLKQLKFDAVGSLVDDDTLSAVAKMERLEVLDLNQSCYGPLLVTATGLQNFFQSTNTISKTLRSLSISLPNFVITNAKDDLFFKPLMESGFHSLEYLLLRDFLVDETGVPFLLSGEFIDKLPSLVYFEMKRYSSKSSCVIFDVKNNIDHRGDDKQQEVLLKKMKWINLLT